MSSDRPTIVFAGGGTGGHLMPAIAVAERLTDPDPDTETAIDVTFLCSDRDLDASILGPRGYPFTTLAARPAALRPFPRAPARFLTGWLRSVRKARQVLTRIADTSSGRVGVVTMGGYVAAPALRAAHALGIPSLLVNLDRVPGKANRVMARWCRQAVTAVPVDPAHSPASLRNLEVIGMPIRREAICTDTPGTCRQRLGLDPDLPTLLITGASQGAGSLNDLLELMCRTQWCIQAMKSWQVLHLCGPSRAGDLQAAYRQAGIPARVVEFCNTMGDAWGSATVALSRAGASSVAEAAVNAVPTVFAPYPWHRDEHQRFNAMPVTEIGGGWCLSDQIEASRNLEGIGRALIDLVKSPERIEEAGHVLRRNPLPDAAGTIAGLCCRLLGCT